MASTSVCWTTCGRDIYHAALGWFEKGCIPNQINEINITLIPKCEHPSPMLDLRLISLCNVVYRIIAKVLANILKPLVSKCVSSEQSAFCVGRFIIDNAIVANEILHHMKCKRKGKLGIVAPKLDISKAYDRVDWGYLKGILLKLG